MTLKEFIEKLKADYNLKHSVSQIEAIITRKAKEMADGSPSIAIDEDTVKDWIINSDSEEIGMDHIVAKKEKKAESVKKAEPVKTEPKEKKEDEKREFEQIGLFDL